MSSSRPALRRCLAAIASLAAFSQAPSTHAAETGITIEAVDAYSCGALSQNISNVDNFRNRMLSVGGYTAGVRFTNSSRVLPSAPCAERASNLPSSAATHSSVRPNGEAETAIWRTCLRSSPKSDWT